MRLLSNTLSAISLLLLILVLLFWTRSHWRYEGILSYSEGATVTVKVATNGKVVEEQVSGRSCGWISFPGQLTYLSIANPVRSNDWESWSAPVDIDASNAAWPMLLAADAGMQQGFRFGSSQTQRDLRDKAMGFSWQLPYRYITIPYWLLAILLAILPYRWVADYRRAKRWEKQGRCARCGQSVQGLSGKCPVCGTAISKSE